MTHESMKNGHALIEDTPLENDKRWVVVSPGGGCSLLLAKAANKKQLAAIGNQCGGRVFLFLETDDFFSEYSRLLKNGVTFEEKPRVEAYGKVAVFADRFGNRWDLIEPNNKPNLTSDKLYQRQ